jgi:hypothetical protein
MFRRGAGWYMPVASQTNLHLIRAFEGPRHTRLERIWERVGALCPGVSIHVHDNLSKGGGPPPLQHGQKLQEIWEGEKADPSAPVCIFTEFDLLPDLPGILGAHEEGLFAGPCAGGDGVRQGGDGLHRPAAPLDIRGGLSDRPIWAAEYATRDPYTRRIRRWGLPGAWFVRIDNLSPLLVGVRLDFTAGGPANDPAAKLPPSLTHLLGAEEGTFSRFGVRVPGVGEHLFFSRHYNDPPTRIVAGFVIGEIQRAVDRACDLYEEYLSGLKRCGLQGPRCRESLEPSP